MAYGLYGCLGYSSYALLIDMMSTKVNPNLVYGLYGCLGYSSYALLIAMMSIKVNPNLASRVPKPLYIGVWPNNC